MARARASSGLKEAAKSGDPDGAAKSPSSRRKAASRPKVRAANKPVPPSARKKTVAESKKAVVKDGAKPSTATAKAAAGTAVRESAVKPVAARKAASKLPFAKGDYVVYPTHGVGKVTGIKRQTIAGFDLQLFVIVFDSDKMTLRVPVDKTTESGLRKISSRDKMRTVVATLKGRARSRRTMWSRRAQEYGAKINSGDPVAVAEVVRDLYRSPSQPEQSYSERQMYEAALDRLVHEYALVQKLDVETATAKIEEILGG